jgi:hypothetical protein
MREQRSETLIEERPVLHEDDLSSLELLHP